MCKHCKTILFLQAFSKMGVRCVMMAGKLIHLGAT